MSMFRTKLIDNIIGLVEKCYYIILIVILLIASFNIFYNLGVIPIYSWDEARHGVSAYEMIKNGNYIVNTYAYKNDYWNLKPPISFWAIAMGYKIAGFNALGLRLFSAFAAIITIVLVAIFSLNIYGRLTSLIATTVLTTTIPFVTEHCARTGDADAIYVLFFTISVMSLILMERSTKWLYLFGLSFSAAFLSKSFHAGNIFFIGILYLVFSKNLFKLTLKQILALVLSASFPILIWAILRYSNDGIAFFKTMIEFDLMARTSRPLEGHIGGKCYYIEHLQWSYFYWNLVFVAVSMAYLTIAHRYITDRKLINCNLIIWLSMIIPFILYTISKTKISWYVLPIYPAAAIWIGYASGFILKERNRNFATQIVLVAMIILSIYKSEEVIATRISNPKEDLSQELIQEIGNLPEYHGEKIYVNHFEQSYWLDSELYADLTPLEGGIEGFLKDNEDKTLLFIKKEDLDSLGNEKDNLKVILENDEAYIFAK